MNEYQITIFRKSGNNEKHSILANSAHEAHKEGVKIMEALPDHQGCRTVLAKLFDGQNQQTVGV